MERENQERPLVRSLGIAGALLTLTTSVYSFAWLKYNTRVGGWGAQGLIFSPEGKSIAGLLFQADSKTGRELWIWDATTGKRIGRHKLTDSYSGVQFSPRGRYIFSGNTLYSSTSASPLFSIPGKYVRAVFSPDEKHLLGLPNDQFNGNPYITCWDIAEQRELWRKRCSPGSWVETLTLSDQGGYVVRYKDRSELWTADSSKPKRFPAAHRFTQASPALQRQPNSFQNRRVVASRWGTGLKHEPIGKIIDAHTGATLVTLEGTTGW